MYMRTNLSPNTSFTHMYVGHTFEKNNIPIYLRTIIAIVYTRTYISNSIPFPTKSHSNIISYRIQTDWNYVRTNNLNYSFVPFFSSLYVRIMYVYQKSLNITSVPMRKVPYHLRANIRTYYSNRSFRKRLPQISAVRLVIRIII